MSDLLAGNVILAAGLTLVTLAIQIGAYAARYAGIITGRIATAISLFSLLVTASRLAALFQVPSLGALADAQANAATDAHRTTLTPEALTLFDHQMRIIVGANSVGVLLGAFLLPFFLAMFVRGIRSFERLGSIPHALSRLFDPRVIRELLPELRIRSVALARYPLNAVPRALLLANVVLFAVYSIGVVASFYASVIDLHARTTATGLSGLVNGVGTVAFALFIDPTTAFIVDQTVREERPRSDVLSMIFWLCVTAFIGTLLAQLILFPAAEYIAWVAEHWPHGKH